MSFGLALYMIPAAILLFGLEIYFLRKTDFKFTWNQTLLNLSLGFFDRLVGLYITERSLFLIERLFEWRMIKEIPANVWTFILTFILVDLIWYIFHRAGHRISIMWGIHLVHHQSNEYNLSVNFALSPMGFLIRSFLYSSLVFIGLPVEYVVLCGYLNAFYQYYLHTEFIKTIPVLEFIFVMPNHHKVHHGSNEEYLDKNYGGVFIIWDRLFKSFAEYKAKPEYGLTTHLPQRDFINVQLFYFKKLLLNFKQYGWKNGVKLIFSGPEYQDAEVPRVLPIRINQRLWKVILGLLIYTVTYNYLLTINNLILMLAIVVANFFAIVLINGLVWDRIDVKSQRPARVK